jgi:hypothetical protein
MFFKKKPPAPQPTKVWTDPFRVKFPTVSDIPDKINLELHLDKMHVVSSVRIKHSAKSLQELADKQTDKSLRRDILWEARFLSHTADCLEFVHLHSKLKDPSALDQKYHDFDDIYRPRSKSEVDE